MPSLASGVTLLILAGAIVFATTRSTVEAVASAEQAGAGSGGTEADRVDPRLAVAGTPQAPGYPTDWLVDTVDQAQDAVTFLIVIPDDAAANAGNVGWVYVFPGGMAVALDFPSPADPESPVRQEYIEVYEAPWTDGDPLETYESDLEHAPDPAKSLMEIDGVTALTVQAHAASDQSEANPAFIRFVTNGVEIQISGGESLHALVAIATSILART
jgi:hypothetical protein